MKKNPAPEGARTFTPSGSDSRVLILDAHRPATERTLKKNLTVYRSDLEIARRKGIGNLSAFLRNQIRTLPVAENFAPDVVPPRGDNTLDELENKLPCASGALSQ